MTYCENCGTFLEDFQDSCGQCGWEKDRSHEFEETQMLWFYPIMSSEDYPRYSARNGSRLKDANTAFSLSALVPGLGQAYDDKRIRGVLVFLMFLSLIAVNVLASTMGEDVWTGLKVILIGTLIAFYIFQLLDAIRVTMDKNVEISRMPEAQQGS